LKTFKTKEEAHDFVFLLIVLQTNQHNPSIKMRIDVK
jgi:Sec7-like guanine-nucleotide exchange factor